MKLSDIEMMKLLDECALPYQVCATSQFTALLIPLCEAYRSLHLLFSVDHSCSYSFSFFIIFDCH